ncbi:MAG: ABC transporter permease [Planctomycetota bacterium]|nr:ABC transporter permease [Planctomycetota bacterium]
MSHRGILIPGSIRGAAEELGRHPGRTLLICQGILWAVALMVGPAALLEGSRGAAVERARELGTDRIQIEVEPGASAELGTGDLKAIESALAADYPAAVVSGQAVAQRLVNPDTGRAYLVGSDVSELSARSLQLIEGRWFVPGSVPPEVVLEQPLADELASHEIDSSLVGEQLWIDPTTSRLGRVATGGDIPEQARRWKVVGVIQSPGEVAVDPLGFGKDHQFSNLVEAALKMLGVAPVSAPWMTDGKSLHVDRSELEPGPVDWIVVSVDPVRINEAKSTVENTLIRRGKAPLLYANAAWSILASPELDGYLVLHDIFFVVTVAIGLLVLINLLLLTGRRRRAEVGLRRAEGATRADIFWQFLWEGVLISLVGAALGMLVGVLIATIRANLDPSAVLTATWPWGTIFKAILIVVTGAAVACAGPAWAVSDTDPAILLREGR